MRSSFIVTLWTINLLWFRPLLLRVASTLDSSRQSVSMHHLDQSRFSSSLGLPLLAFVRNILFNLLNIPLLTSPTSYVSTRPSKNCFSIEENLFLNTLKHNFMWIWTWWFVDLVFYLMQTQLDVESAWGRKTTDSDTRLSGGIVTVMNEVIQCTTLSLSLPYELTYSLFSISSCFNIISTLPVHLTPTGIYY